MIALEPAKEGSTEPVEVDPSIQRSRPKLAGAPLYRKQSLTRSDPKRDGVGSCDLCHQHDGDQRDPYGGIYCEDCLWELADRGQYQ